jgi:hypothetical protein
MQVIATGNGQQKAMCIAMSNIANTNMRDAPLRYFQYMYDYSDSFSGAIDYAVSLFDDDAGRCTNFYTSPYVMTIMPNPIDYFRVCGLTDICRIRCFDLYRAFDDALAQDANVRALTYTVAVESLYFTDADTLLGKTSPPFVVLTLIEHTDCLAICDSVSMMAVPNKCVSVTGFDNTESLTVTSFCIPAQMGLGVRESAYKWHVFDSSTWASSVLSVRFLDVNTLMVVRTDGVFIYGEYGILAQIIIITEDVYTTTQIYEMQHIDTVFSFPSVKGDASDIIVYGMYTCHI